MANKLFKFRGNRFIHSISNDGILCFYDDSQTVTIPNYIHHNSKLYSFDSMFCDVVKNDLLVSFVSTSLTLKDLCRISRDSNLSFVIEHID